MKTPDTDVKRILAVEDEPAIGTLCHRILTSEGFEVDIAANGKIGQDMIEEKQYDLFLLDIRLPVMPGKKLYQWLDEIQGHHCTNTFNRVRIVSLDHGRVTVRIIDSHPGQDLN